MYEQLIADLKEDAEWAEANEWETPLMLSDHLKQAVEAIGELQKVVDHQRDILMRYGGETGIRNNRELANKYWETISDIDSKCKEWLKVKGKCPTCARCSDNREHTTTCPIEEHYALPLDGYCHLWEKKHE